MVKLRGSEDESDWKVWKRRKRQLILNVRLFVVEIMFRDILISVVLAWRVVVLDFFVLTR